jgi:hypothetical protein
MLHSSHLLHLGIFGLVWILFRDISDSIKINKCFVDASWLVIRFAEEQVSSQPERCARFIAGAYRSIDK